MLVSRISNFISDIESLTLSNWILSNKDKDFFKDANMGGNRKTTRYSDANKFTFPPEALKIREKIINTFSLTENEKRSLIPPFKQGIVASYAENEDTCFEHLDPVWFDGLDTLHCNIITQSPEKGGEVIIDGQEFIMKERELFCYRVSKNKHQVLKVDSKKPRLMWIFGFCILPEQWERNIVSLSEN
jgi:hypothetical protein